LARTVGDVREAYQLMRGPHRRDPSSTTTPPPPVRSKEGLTIGTIHQVDSDIVDPLVARTFDTFTTWLDGQGHRLRPVRLPEGGADIVGTILTAFTAADLHGESTEELDRRDPDLVALAHSAKRFSALDLAAAQSRRVDYLHAAEDLFDTVDYVVSPTVSHLPFPVGGHSPAPYDHDVTQWHRWCSMTYPWNLAGNPAVSLPWVMTPDGIPIGMQIIGPRGGDLGVLELAEVIERQHPWIADYSLL
jgi:Asp-tRNA(Asn)/Glu-tRNA(Gln) amidotransferase A subunit family amidase